MEQAQTEQRASEAVEQGDESSPIPLAERDVQRIAAWKEASARALSDSDLKSLSDRVADQRAKLDRLTREMQEAAALHATVNGWVATSDLLGVAARTVHAWHKDLCPSLPDLSSVPTVEVPREAKRIERRKAELARLDEERKHLEARLAELPKIGE